jgi:hemoglobin/transferrin/lactoferrin receptor protein
MKHIVAALAVLSINFCFGQKIKITDAENNRPIVEALIYNPSGTINTFSDSRGFADISAFKSSDSIFIHQIGYQLNQTSYSDLEQNDFKIKLNLSGLDLDEVVISANKWEQKRKDLSAHAITISKRDIQLLNPQTAADLLTLSGAVFVQKSQQGGGSPMLRGFSTNRVLLVIDGVRMNTSIFRAGNVQNALRLDANNIENAEAVFGPGSLIYGSDAIGGVMDYKTISPKLSNTDKAQFSGNALGRFSSANLEKTGHVDFNIGLKKIAFLTSFTFSDYDDLRMGSNGGFDSYRRAFYQQTNLLYDSLGRKTVQDTFYKNQNPLQQRGSGFNQWNVLQKTRFQPNSYNRLTAAFHMSRSSNVPRYDRLTDFAANGTPTFAEWYYGPEQWLMGNLEYLYSKPNAAFNDMKITLAYQQNKESRNDRRFGSRWLRRQNETVHAATANIDFNKNFNNKYFIFYGLEAVMNNNISVADRLDVRMDTTQKFAARYPNSVWQSYAAYIAGRVKLGGKWVLNAGVRYNHFIINANFDTTLFKLPFDNANNNFGAVTGSAGLVFNPTSNWKIFANFSSGFRAPNIDDIGKVFESAPGILVVPNKNLKPEYSLNGEAGIEKRFGKTAILYIGGYYNYLLNALTLAPYQIDGSDSLFFDDRNNSLRAVQNSSYAFVWGVQTTVKFDFGKGFGAWGSFNYQTGREQIQINGKSELYPMRHVAPIFGTVHITYKKNKVGIDLYSDYSGSIKPSELAIRTLENPTLFPVNEFGERFSPPWYTLNVKASYDVAKYLTLNAGVENITDQQYRTYSSGIAAAGINFTAGLRARF